MAEETQTPEQDQQAPVADSSSASAVKLDLSKSQPLPPAVTLDMSKSKPLSAAQPGAFQTRKGGPIQNVNSMPAPSRADEVSAAQTGIHAAASVVPGGELAAGAVKGLYQTGIGAGELVSKGLNKLGIHGEEIDARAQGDVSPFSEAMTTPEGAGQHVGSFGEEVGEWMAGEAALKGMGLLAKTAKYAPHLIEVMEQFPKATKLILGMSEGAAIGGAQGAVKEGSLEGAKAGVEGGAVGGGAGEVLGMVAKPVAKAMGIGTSSVEDALRAAQPGKRNLKFMDDWATAQPRLVKEIEAGGKFKDMGEAADRIGDVRRSIWNDEVMPAIDRHADEVFDTTKVADKVRKLADSPALKKNFPEDAKYLQEFADKYTSGTPLFSGDKTVAEAEKEIELYNAKLADEGYWKKTPKERAVAEKANPKIAAWRAASDEIRNGLYDHLENAGEKGIKALKNEYGAIGNVENEVRGQVNVAGRQRPLSLKQIIGLTAGFAHGGLGGAAIAAIPVLDKLYNAPEELLNRAVAKSAPPGPIKKAVQAGFRAGTPIAEAATGVAGENLVRFIASDGSVHEVNSSELDKAKEIDPGLKVQ